MYNKILCIISTVFLLCCCLTGCKENENNTTLDFYISNEYLSNYNEEIDNRVRLINELKDYSKVEQDLAITYEDFIVNDQLVHMCLNKKNKNSIYVFGYKDIKDLESLVSKLEIDNFYFPNNINEKVGFIISFIKGSLINISIIPERQSKFIIDAIILESKNIVDYLFEENNYIFPKLYIDVPSNAFFQIMNNLNNITSTESKYIINITSYIYTSNNISNFAIKHIVFGTDYQVQFSPMQQKNITQYYINKNGESDKVDIPKGDIVVTSSSNEIQWRFDVSKKVNYSVNKYIVNSECVLHNEGNIDIQFDNEDFFLSTYRYNLNLWR